MNILDEILENMPDQQFLKADGLDDACIGYDVREYRLVYSVEKCIECMMKGSDMDHEEASEFFYFNTADSYVGEKTPIFVIS